MIEVSVNKCGNCDNDKVEIKPSEIMVGFYAECTKCECTSCSCVSMEEAVKDWNEIQNKISKGI